MQVWKTTCIYGEAHEQRTSDRQTAFPVERGRRSIHKGVDTSARDDLQIHDARL